MMRCDVCGCEIIDFNDGIIEWNHRDENRKFTGKELTNVVQSN